MNDRQAAPCQECGYDWESLGRGQILLAVTSLADEHSLLLTSVAGERLRDHPRPASWSPLEYGCHVRDVLRFQRERVALAQAEETPLFTSMRRDERAVEERYNDQDGILAELINKQLMDQALAVGLRQNRSSISSAYQPYARHRGCTPQRTSAGPRSRPTPGPV